MQEKNKEVVRALYKEFFNDHVVESADKYVREDYIQHNPGVAQGREALKNVDPEGNTKCRVVDMYRLVDGKLAEHWDVLQPC